MADKNPTRQNYVLKSGMGTVAAADYDAAVHGPVVEETDAQHEARIAGRVHPQQTAPRVHLTPGGAPMTTIANLATFNSDEVEKPAPPPPPPSPIAVPVVGARVAVAAKDDKDAKDAAFGSKK